MFYTKYRPQKFSELAQPNEVAGALSTQILSNKTVHAYLFVGPRGTGKTTIARILAKALNCKEVSDIGDPCTECDSCRAVKDGSFLDLIEIDAASNRGIDDVRELRERIRLAPVAGRKKIYIIDEVHMLTAEAFNAILKTLEEPPKHATFVLCTTESHKIPDTIKSRCQVYTFKRAPQHQLVERLSKISKSEGVELSKDDLKQISAAANGSFRDAETLLQQVVEGGINVGALLNMGSQEVYEEFLENLFSKNAKGGLHCIEKVYEDGLDLYVWIGGFLEVLRKKLLECPSNSVELVHIIDRIIKAHNDTKSSFITQLPIELAVVELCAGDGKKDTSPEDNPKDDDNKSNKNDIIAPSVKSNKVSITTEEVSQKWVQILKAVSGINNSVMALLKSSKLIQVLGTDLQLEVPYDFHKERIESSKNKRIIEKVLANVLGENLGVTCSVKKGFRQKLTDKNIIVPSGVTTQESQGNLMDCLDGGLPI